MKIGCFCVLVEVLLLDCLSCMVNLIELLMNGLLFSFDLCITKSHWNFHILNYVMAGVD